MTGENSVPRVVVGIVADPGIPSMVANNISGKLSRVLENRILHEVQWDVHVSSEELSLDAQNRIAIKTKAQNILPDRGWDILVCLTDLPRRNGKRPVIADVRAGDAVALVSMPAIGGLRIESHTMNTLAHVIGLISTEKLHEVAIRNPAQKHHHIRRRITEGVSPVRQVPSSDEDVQLLLSGLRGRVRLLLGMVRDNRPWWLVPSLSRAIAAAVATGAFGIFYPTLWRMANALSFPRLAFISLFAIVAMVSWLIINNSLWEHARDRADREEAVLYNLATVLTLLIGVCCMYLVLLVTTLTGALAVISADYFGTMLGKPVGVRDYVALVWLASSMGTVAGALGASLETESAVRRATFSKRERERRERSES